jgi:hypothetical protein
MDTRLSKLIPFTISAKGAKDAKQYGSIFNYHGPDEATIAELQTNHESWRHNPHEFWEQKVTPDLSMLDFQAQIVGRYIFMNRSDV